MQCKASGVYVWKLVSESYSEEWGSKAYKLITELYEYYMNNIDALPDNYKMFIEKMDEPLERVVCDYIAGMSDQYSVAKFEEIFVPASWKV